MSVLMDTPVVAPIRAAFEVWYRRRFPALELKAQSALGTYTTAHAEWCWIGYLGRATSEMDAPPRVVLG